MAEIRENPTNKGDLAGMGQKYRECLKDERKAGVIQNSETQRSLGASIAQKKAL